TTPSQRGPKRRKLQLKYDVFKTRFRKNLQTLLDEEQKLSTDDSKINYFSIQAQPSRYPPVKLCSKMSQTHTILLLQSTTKLDSRTYSDYETVDECLDGICKVFEEHLKKRNPMSPSITYDISELFDFIDQLADLSCLCLQKATGTYKPHNKEWIKQEIFQLLRKQAAGAK
ncbi:unnamed protein product, partial [Didymodactylos carnosus]